MNVEIEKAWGGTMVRAVDAAGVERRFWFDETDAGRVVLCAQILVREPGLRYYTPRNEWAVPGVVQEALIDEGLAAETIYDTRGIEIA